MNTNYREYKVSPKESKSSLLVVRACKMAEFLGCKCANSEIYCSWGLKEHAN
jgi:hypothetical protein